MGIRRDKKIRDPLMAETEREIEQSFSCSFSNSIKLFDGILKDEETKFVVLAYLAVTFGPVVLMFILLLIFN